MPGMAGGWNAPSVIAMSSPYPPPPAVRLKKLDDLQIAGQAIAMDGIEQEEVPVAPQSAIPVEELGRCRREQRFAVKAARYPRLRFRHPDLGCSTRIQKN
jgi:hypothetical protein